MVAIAQLAEHLIVVQEVARSSRVSHPTSKWYTVLTFMSAVFPCFAFVDDSQNAVSFLPVKGML